MKRKKMCILTLAALSSALILSLGTFITSFAKEGSTTAGSKSILTESTDTATAVIWTSEKVTLRLPWTRAP